MPNNLPANRRQLAWYRKIVFSIIPVLVLLLGVELILTVLGVRPVTDKRDPYVGFTNLVPLFEEVQPVREPQVMMTAESKLVWFNRQAFQKIKSANTKRIFCVGGSTTFGRPYSDVTSYAGWMRELLPFVDRSCSWEVINAGGVSYASYRVAAVMEELAQYEPDLFIVYSAQNEFLERRTYAGLIEQPKFALKLQAAVARTRTFALLDGLFHGQDVLPAGADVLPAEVDERLNHTIGPSDYSRDPVWRRKVIAHYRVNLRRMVRIAEDAGAKIVFVVPASNEKDCSPFKSELQAGLQADEQTRFFELMDRAEAAFEEQQFSAACDFCRQALAIDATFAQAQYRLGKSLFALGDFVAAHVALANAIEEDVCPLRAIAALSTELRQVAQENSLPLVDFQRLLREKCRRQLGHECLGKEFFLDHVHPDIETHRELAMWIIECLQQTGFVKGLNIQDAQHAAGIGELVRRVESKIDDREHGVALRNLAKVFHWSGKFEEAAPKASDALELLPNDPESRYLLADCLKNLGDSQGSLRQYSLLFEDTPGYVRAFLPYGELLEECGLHQQAKAYLMLAVYREPDNAYALFLLGQAHLGLGEYAFAADALQRAHELYPDDLLTHELLNVAKQGLPPSP